MSPRGRSGLAALIVTCGGQVIATNGSQGYENEADARSMSDRIMGGEFKAADRKIIRPKKKSEP